MWDVKQRRLDTAAQRPVLFIPSQVFSAQTVSIYIYIYIITI